MLYLDFVVDVVQLGLYAMFFFALMTHYGLPLHLIRVIYTTFRSFYRRIELVIRHLSSPFTVFLPPLCSNVFFVLSLSSLDFLIVCLNSTSFSSSRLRPIFDFSLQFVLEPNPLKS